MTTNTDELRLQITGMDCASCAQTIRKGVAGLPGVDSAELNFTTGTLCVRGAAPAERVVARVRELGYDVAGRAPAGDRERSDHDHEAHEHADHDHADPPTASDGRPATGLLAYLWGAATRGPRSSPRCWCCRDCCSTSYCQGWASGRPFSRAWRCWP